MVQKNKKTMIKEKGKEICQRVLDINDYMMFMDNGIVSHFGEWTDENIAFISRYFENE